MKCRSLLSIPLITMVTTLLAIATNAGAETKRPNFVFFLVDDLGWANLSSFGSTFHETPNIDSLAASGMKFTNAYAAGSVCSPTRASIMTGRHPVRVDITDWIPGRNAGDKHKFLQVEDRDNLALEEVTIAEVLKKNDYSTFFAGKWHLGGKGHWPNDQGFDINIGGHDRGSPPGGYYAPWKNPALKAKHDGEYLTERLTGESVDFMKRCDEDKPFLLYLSYYNVHTPIQEYKKRVDHYKKKAEESFTQPSPPIAEHDGLSRTRQDNPAYASMVAAVDDSVGAVLRTLDELGIANNTVVFFFSDNGGLCTLKKPGPTSNLPLRSGKGWLYEGGIREPMIVRVPGVTKAGSVCESPVVSMDFFPTMLELAGLPLQPKLHADGSSLVPLLRGDASSSPRQLVWHYPHYHGSTWAPGAAIRVGDWKLIEFFETGTSELFRLSSDPGERDNLAGKELEKVAELKKKLHGWRERMGAKMPVKNPSYRP